MIKNLMCGLAMMGCALPGYAEVQGFDWSFTGFAPSWSTESQPWPHPGEFDPSI